MPSRELRTTFATLLLGLTVSPMALAQVPAHAGSETASNPAPPASTPAPASAAAPAPATAAVPAPAAAPALAPAPAAAQPGVVVPPGYMLVPIPDAAPKTRYDVQYAQPRGALPPGMELPYEEGDPIPAGYRLRAVPRRGLIIGGAVVAGVPWMLGVTAATAADFDDKTGFLVVPVLGPWLTLLAGGGKDAACNRLDSSESFTFCSSDRSGIRALLVFDGLVQTAGGVMFVAGLAIPRKRLVREDVTVSVVPTPVGRDGYGLGAVGTF